MSRNRFVFSLLALCAVATTSAVAANVPLKPRMQPPKGGFQLHDGSVEVPRIIIKLHEGTHVRLRGGNLRQLSNERTERERQTLTSLRLTDTQVQSDLARIEHVLRTEPLVQGIQPLFTASEEQLAARRATGEQRSGNELADLSLYTEIPLKIGTHYADVVPLLEQLDRLQTVETAYAEPLPQPAAADIAPPTGSFTTGQGYLQAAPRGIDAQFAWTKRGGNGAGVRIVDVEGGWRSTHEDMPALFHTGGTQIDDVDWRNHGTAVLGEMVGAANEYGVTGIANGARAGYEAIGAQSTASAIFNAGVAAGDGGVVLIELHAKGPDTSPCTCNPGQCKYVAMEYWQANFDAISAASSNGSAVVEAAGNGSADLDDAIYLSLFDRTRRDSGAILVGASSATDRVPMCWTNHGSRVDVHGWGESVVTLGYGDRFNGGGDENQFYTAFFGGTSSASPIVTAAVACLQGALTSAGRFPLSPIALRDLLSDTGTPQAPHPWVIGPLPNLRAALARLRL